jgi:hypothetical protein
MNQITEREIAGLTDQEKQDMRRWIGEHSALSELSAQHRTHRTVAQAASEAEQESPDAQAFAEPEEFPWDDEVATEAA